LQIHKGNLIVATSGRAFWILDDLNVLDQYKSEDKAQLYNPEDAIYGYWGSPLSGDSESFTGTSSEGVNPANGMVLYYELPKLEDSTELTLEIRDSNGKMVRSFSSAKDKEYKQYDGGPPEPSIIPKKKGLNRFVWDLRYPTMPGIPNVYIEANYKGHTAPPGEYNLKLKWKNNTLTTKCNILKNPLFETKEEQYQTYDSLMADMETQLTQMHQKVNQLFNVQQQLKSIVKDLVNKSLKSKGDSLVKALDEWDKKMVQRKSKAYDDVENFPNKFTAEYLFLINATGGRIPRVNQSSIDRKNELDAQWAGLENQAKKLLEESVPAFNKQLWAAGIGAIRIKQKH
jgi:hypothetical protein